MTGRIDLAAIRADHSLASVIGAVVKLRRRGAEWVACCPFHPDRSPSFTIYAGGERGHCFGCGWTRDVLDAVRTLHGTDLRGAAEMLTGGVLPLVEVAKPAAPEKADTRAAADRIVQRSDPIVGTPAEAYLRSRGIAMELPHTLRFATLAPPRHSGVLEANGGAHLPALVAVVTDAAGELTAIQRTYLTPDGRKAATTDPKGKVKFSLGHVAGGAIQLGPPAASIVVCEGLEDGLTLAQALGRTVWVAAGTSMLPRMRLPDVVRSVVIAADNDAAGDKSARLAGEAFLATGRKVRIMRPSAGFKDFNAEHLEDPS